ncbi:carbon starvation protein A [Candidatus Latescibacterota bacterium]
MVGKVVIMLILFFFVVTIILFLLAGRFYARFIARSIGEDACNLTPAQRINDGRDYVPTKYSVVFAHHFTAIAGAGPIIGPTMGLIYGFLPAWLWIVFGGIFIGAVHDYTALFACMREGGKSMAEVARKSLGQTGFNLFIVFTILMIVLVTSSFLVATAVSLTSLWPLEKIGVAEGGMILKTVVVDGVVMGQIGGIASMSFVIITLCSPLLGWLIHRKKMNMFLMHILAVGICVLSIIIGILQPVTLSPILWMILISIYVLFAAEVPIWLILQPRSLINAYILYTGMVLIILSLVVNSFKGVGLSMPLNNIADGVSHIGFLWPMLFITIACGAISGFHSLVAGGTTGKQIANECGSRQVGFYAMLLESTLAVCVLVTVGVGLNIDDYSAIVWPTEPGVASNPILGFSLAAGSFFNSALNIPRSLAVVFGILMVGGFVLTTLDVAVRLNRYLFEELWSIIFEKTPKLLRNCWFNSGLAVICMWILAYKNAFSALWPIFGTANQLLAALGLIAVSAWLLIRRRRYIFALLPAIFMIVTTLASLVILMLNYLRGKNYILIMTDAFMFLLTIGVIILAVKVFWKPVYVDEEEANPGSDMPAK